MHPLILVLIAVSLGAVGQILMKQGMDGISITGSVGRQLGTILRAVATPYVFLGIMFYVFSTFFWLKVLSTQELSYVYPMIAVSYVTVTVLSIIFLNERVSAMRWVSLMVICLGVAMLAIWGANKQQPQEPEAKNPHINIGEQETSAKEAQKGGAGLNS